MESHQPFMVIIAGASVVGLTLANALEKAGVDFLVLEKGDVAPYVGASITMLYHSSRVFDQLGVWEDIRRPVVPLDRRRHFDEHGRLFEDSGFLGLVGAAAAGRHAVFVERRAYLQALYDGLGDKSRVRARVGLVSFAEDDEGVTVFTSDGGEVRGSILVGADGIHSTVRGLMADSVAKSDPQRAKKLNEGFTANYRVIFGTSKNQRQHDPDARFLEDGEVQNVYYRGVSGLTANGVRGLVFWFLFVKLDSPATTPNCPRYSEADAEETLKQYGHLDLGPGYTFNELWEQRVKGVMVPLEEGVIEGSWNSGGRVVLAGDAVTKSTINSGLGGNTNVAGVCELVNELLSVLKDNRDPGKQEIKGVFDRYEERQRPRAKACVTVSSYTTRFEAMDTWWLRILRLVSPWVPDSLKAKAFEMFVADFPLLNFLPDPDKKSA